MTTKTATTTVASVVNTGRADGQRCTEGGGILQRNDFGTIACGGFSDGNVLVFFGRPLEPEILQDAEHRHGLKHGILYISIYFCVRVILV